MNQTGEKSKYNIEDDVFAREIDLGLSSRNKFISSKYFYDKKGDELFMQIMDLEEYYLTRSEYEIFTDQKADIFNALPYKDEEFDLTELGSGDGTKTKILIREFMEHNGKFHYLPIDISDNSLQLLKQNLNEHFPVEVKTFNCSYLEGLREVYKYSSDRPKLILFLGSNIGNLLPEAAFEFLSEINEIKNEQDHLLIGIDLKKDPEIIKNAYNDHVGVTKEFNLNVLDRINSELQANFDRENFYHYPTYDPGNGAAKSYLISKKDQSVQIKKIDKIYQFRQGEAIFTEISQKYSLEDFNDIAERAGLTMIHSFMDSRKYFADVLLK